MSTKTALTIIITIAFLAALYIWYFGAPERSLNPPLDEFIGDLREPDASAPAAGICDFYEGSTVAFKLNEGIPTPRCARVLAGQSIAFTNKTNQIISFTFAFRPFVIEPGVTVEDQRRVEDYLAPGVHVAAIEHYGGSGPEVWVQDSRTFELTGTVSQQFVSARAIVVETLSGEITLAITNETRILNTQGSPVSPEEFSLVLPSGTAVTVIANLPEAKTGTALEIRAERPGQDVMPACTLEAKICPDGTAVGRTGPNCEFAPCPQE